MNLAGIGSVLTLIILGLVLVSPTTSNETHAESFSTSVNTNTTAYVRSNISVSVSSAVDFEITPTVNGSFSESTAQLNVSTNNTTGFSVYLRTSDDTGALTPTNPEVTNAAIGKPNGVLSATDYTNNLNTWGYAVMDSGNVVGYSAIPSSTDAAIITTTELSPKKDYTLGFGVAIGPDLPAGLYTNELVISAVANPIETRGINDLTYMQDMTPEICAVSFENESKELIDSRDGRAYTVTKLKDDNCWMTDNLAITFGEGTTEDGYRKVRKLTSGDSDVKKDWTVIVDTATDTSNFVADVNGVQSWSLDTSETSSGQQWYYQWNAATAGTGQNATEYGDDAEGSICPSGWKLPITSFDTSSSNIVSGVPVSGSYAELFQAYSIIDNKESVQTLLTEPLNFTLSGMVLDGKLVYYSSDGQFWCGTAGREGTRAARMFYNTVHVYSFSDYARYQGLSVRCVAR